ncbi:hypothetical protein EVAR_58018_1 [Eumeta japonica]|uniref:Uncharacterized protein n=1 Tax=Eumeta variegata TaxID=151549 RepID=A0A4C1YBJ8_EUMVA|nr:hypothetical protein EVAR_58018_1 [Eumeta japonica]
MTDREIPSEKWRAPRHAPLGMRGERRRRRCGHAESSVAFYRPISDAYAALYAHLNIKTPGSSPGRAATECHRRARAVLKDLDLERVTMAQHDLRNDHNRTVIKAVTISTRSEPNPLPPVSKATPLNTKSPSLHRRTVVDSWSKEEVTFADFYLHHARRRPTRTGDIGDGCRRRWSRRDIDAVSVASLISWEHIIFVFYSRRKCTWKFV